MTAERRRPKLKSSPKPRAEELTLTIDRIDDDGLGLATHDGKPVVVFDALPGADLAAVNVGQEVQFVLVQQSGGEYALESIHPGQGGATGVSGEPVDGEQEHNHD